MKIKCDTEAIRKGVFIVGNAISRKDQNTILDNIMIKTQGNSIELSSTDREVSLRHKINDVDVKEQGSMLCFDSKLTDILKEWDGESISLNESKRTCSIKGKRSSFKLMCADPEAFPAIPEFKDKGSVEIDRDVLVDMIRKTAFIVKGDRSANGVFLNIEKDQAIMVANDGRRLAEIKRKIPPRQTEGGLRPVGDGQAAAGQDKSCIIPIKTIPQILNMVKDHEGAVKIKIDHPRIFIQAGNTTLCSQLIEGAYPEYAEVIPEDLDKEISIDREAFFSAVRRCAVMTTDEYKLLEFTFEDNLLQLLCTSPDVGESKIDVPIEYDGEKVAIGFNPDYINDLSKAIDTETVTLELKDSGTACIFAVGNSYTYVLMPMAIAPPSPAGSDQRPTGRRPSVISEKSGGGER